VLQKLQTDLEVKDTDVQEAIRTLANPDHILQCLGSNNKALEVLAHRVYRMWELNMSIEVIAKKCEISVPRVYDCIVECINFGLHFDGTKLGVTDDTMTTVEVLFQQERLQVQQNSMGTTEFRAELFRRLCQRLPTSISELQARVAYALFWQKESGSLVTTSVPDDLKAELSYEKVKSQFPGMGEVPVRFGVWAYLQKCRKGICLTSSGVMEDHRERTLNSKAVSNKKDGFEFGRGPRKVFRKHKGNSFAADDDISSDSDDNGATGRVAAVKAAPPPAAAKVSAPAVRAETRTPASGTATEYHAARRLLPSTMSGTGGTPSQSWISTRKRKEPSVSLGKTESCSRPVVATKRLRKSSSFQIPACTVTAEGQRPAASGQQHAIPVPQRRIPQLFGPRPTSAQQPGSDKAATTLRTEARGDLSGGGHTRVPYLERSPLRAPPGSGTSSAPTGGPKRVTDASKAGGTQTLLGFVGGSPTRGRAPVPARPGTLPSLTTSPKRLAGVPKLPSRTNSPLRQFRTSAPHLPSASSPGGASAGTPPSSPMRPPATLVRMANSGMPSTAEFITAFRLLNKDGTGVPKADILRYFSERNRPHAAEKLNLLLNDLVLFLSNDGVLRN